LEEVLDLRLESVFALILEMLTELAYLVFGASR
jgi:hypothetical protein